MLSICTTSPGLRFFIALRLGSYILIWLFSPKNDPILIKGMADARTSITIVPIESSKAARLFFLFIFFKLSTIFISNINNNYL